MSVDEISYPKDYMGLSTDTKPVGVSSGSTFYEVDTKNVYIYDGSTWWLM